MIHFFFWGAAGLASDSGERTRGTGKVVQEEAM